MPRGRRRRPGSTRSSVAIRRVVAIGDRRAVLKLCGFAGAVIGVPAMAMAAPTAIVVPTRPFILRRALERGLAGGASLLVTREWRGQFEREQGRVVARGEQISCDVVAPAVLETIAAIERNRIAPGPFPAHLDGDGRIVGLREAPATGRGAAVAAAMAVLRQAGSATGALREARADLDRLAHASGAVMGETPPDLFFPLQGEASDRRDLALPGGETGEVSVHLSAEAGPGGLLERFERKIITRIGSDARESRETWTLSMA